MGKKEQEEKLDEQSDLRKRKIIIYSSIASILLLFFITLSYFIYQYIYLLPEGEIYYTEKFEEGLGDWEGIDVTWIEQNHEEEQTGIVKLARKQFISPYIMYNLPVEQSPPETFMFHLRTRVNAITDNAVTLGTLFFPNGPIAIVVDQDGQLGLSEHLFASVEYAKRPRMSFKEWQDVYLFIDNTDRTAIIFLNDKFVSTTSWETTSFPTQEIWLGSIWYKGSENYGSTLDVQYDRITLGNEGIREKPSFIRFIFEKIMGLFR